jgi:hypothetical protein
LDVVYLVLLALEKLGIIWDVKRRPRRPKGDHLPLGVGARS